MQVVTVKTFRGSRTDFLVLRCSGCIRDVYWCIKRLKSVLQPTLKLQSKLKGFAIQRLLKILTWVHCESWMWMHTNHRCFTTLCCKYLDIEIFFLYIFIYCASLNKRRLCPSLFDIIVELPFNSINSKWCICIAVLSPPPLLLDWRYFCVVLFFEFKVPFIF